MIFDEKEYQTIILAALLHDIGKLSQREGGEYYARHADFSGNFVNSLKDLFGDYEVKKLSDLIESHHKMPTKRSEYLLHIADKLAAAERIKEERSRLKSNEAALVAITSRLRLTQYHGKEKYFRLNSLKIEKDTLFPFSEPKIENGKYSEIWNRFIDKVKSLKKYQSTDFKSIFYILKEMGSFIPSATPWEDDEYNRTVPDVSLFDHSKITCALASCLCHLTEDNLSNNEMKELIDTLNQHYNEKDPSIKEEILNESIVAKKQLFVLLRADIAGIQGFIYNITKPRAETKGTSKRLRGRSFYITILTDVISDWIIRELNLPITNILFCGGGRFDILLPKKDEIHTKIEEIKGKLNDWLLEEFNGELSIQIVSVNIAPKDFFEFDKIYRIAEDELNENKRKKFKEMMLKIEFFKPDKLIEEWCNLCLTNPILKEEQECKQCEIQRNIGSNLPKKDFITFVYDLDATKNIQGTPIPFKNFGITVYLQDKVNIEELFKNNFKKEIHIQKINPEFNENIGLDFLMENAEKKPISFGFKLLGNSAPISKKSYQILSPPHEPVEKGDVLEFEEIAELSSGAKYLGILKIDIDHLGLLFGIGLENPSISRIATLSSNIEIFFNGWINKICEEITREWNSNLEENDLRKGLVESLFYIVYSGGDDLFIIGPWDQVIDLALKIYNDFKQYTSENPNITLSGGIFFVKPAFPIQRFSILVTKELENAKKLGRNKVTLFGETVEWRDNTKSLESLIKFAKELSNEVENKEKPLSKSFVYFLINLKKAFHIGIKNKEDINWIPHFLYSHARRVTKEVEERLNLRTQFMEKRSKIKIPVSYVSLKTRKE